MSREILVRPMGKLCRCLIVQGKVLQHDGRDPENKQKKSGPFRVSAHKRNRETSSLFFCTKQVTL